MDTLVSLVVSKVVLNVVEVLLFVEALVSNVVLNDVVVDLFV